MAYNPLNPNGQATMANSQPVVISSNQSPVSVTGALTIVGNPSVSGTVNVGNFPATSGSVVAFQGTNPFIITGSVQASLTPAANQSVSGTVGTSVIGLPNVNVGGSVVAFQGTSPFIVNFQNSSIFTGVQGSVAVAIVSGSIAASFTPPANQSVSGTVTANQGTNPWIVTGSVQGSFSPSGNQSVSGTVGASVIGLTPIQIPGSVAVAIISGSIAASFTPPANQSVSGTVGASIIGNVNTTITSVATIGGFFNVNLVGGSILTSSTPNQSVSGTVGASIIGLPPINVSAINGVPISVDTGNTNTGTQRMIQATSSNYNTGQVTIASVATSILGTNINRIRAVLTNTGTNVVFYGNSSVVSSITGNYLAGIAGYPAMIRSSASVWGISPTGAQVITFLEEIH